jgi:hypothetical protein
MYEIEEPELVRAMGRHCRSLIMMKYGNKIIDEILNSKDRDEYRRLYDHMHSIYKGIVNREEITKYNKEVPLSIIENEIVNMSVKMHEQISGMIRIENKYCDKFIKEAPLISFEDKKPNMHITNNAISGEFKFMKLQCNLDAKNRRRLEFYDKGHVFYSGIISVFLNNVWNEAVFNVINLTEPKFGYKYTMNELRNKYSNDHSIILGEGILNNNGMVSTTIIMNNGSGSFTESSNTIPDILSSGWISNTIFQCKRLL